MDFTQLYKQTSQLCKYSTFGNLLATAVQHRLVIRDSESLQVLKIHNLPSQIHQIDWSPNSQLILAASYSSKKAIPWIRVFKVLSDSEDVQQESTTADEELVAKIDEGISGITSAQFLTNSCIIVLSEFNIRLSLWSLSGSSCAVIKYPKLSMASGVTIRKDRRYFAFLERAEGKDHVGIIDCNSLVLIREFEIPTVDAEGIRWSKDGKYLAIQDCPFCYQLYIYSPDGNLLSKYCSSEFSLGVKCISWSTKFLAVGGYSGKVHLLNQYTWNSSLDLDWDNLSEEIKAISYDLNVHHCSDVLSSLKAVIGTKNNIQTIVQTNGDVKLQNIGISLLEWNLSGELLAIKSEQFPNAILIYDLLAMKPVVLLNHQKPVRQLIWNPVRRDLLAICCGTNFLYMWDGVARSVPIPASENEFEFSRMAWNPSGTSIVLIGGAKERFCVAFCVE